jgi:hypothetical protein
MQREAHLTPRRKPAENQEPLVKRVARQRTTMKQGHHDIDFSEAFG